MKNSRVASLMIVSLLGCSGLVAPNYKLSAAKQTPYSNMPQYCKVVFTFTNTRSYADTLWIKVFVLDAGNNTVTEQNVIFDTTLPGKTNQKDVLIASNCTSVRKVVLTTNAHVVEPSSFDWNN
jgi:archaellum component FlaF (FlaF/FlaG flagellin family)